MTVSLPGTDSGNGAGRTNVPDELNDADAPSPALMNITVSHAPAPRVVVEVALQLPPGTTLRNAVEASGLRQRFTEIDLAPGSVGVWGRKAPLDHPLREADRVEIWRGLRVDPKLARRERFQSQGAGRAGLFVQRRPGAKKGY